jgi:glycosyltransferase involved in cell wall biosynthesis
VSVVANGVDVESFRPQAVDPALRDRWGLAGKKVLLYAGTFQPYEGLDLLVKAMPEVVRQVPDAHLVIVGGSAGLAGGAKATSPEEQLLLNATRDSGATAHVTFTGRIPHGEVKDMYALADAMCYPRRWTLTTALTTPLKPLEAMAMAKPVIASDVPPMKELVMDMKTGLLFKAGDHLDLAAKCVTLLSDAGLRQRLGDAAREWVLAERQWTTLVSRYREVYERVAPAAARLREKVPA